MEEALEQVNKKKTKEGNKKKILTALGSFDCQRNMGQAADNVMLSTYKNWQDGTVCKTGSHGRKAPS